jgi:ribosomal protein S12 methylthiotransferase
VARIKKCVPEVDAVGRPGEVDQWIRELAKHFGTFVRQGQPQRFLLSGPGTAYLKIAEGCSRRCTFCLIPALRGPLHSRPLEEMVAEAVNLAKAGTRELVLVAQDTTRYGCDLYGKPALNRLLPKLARIAGLRWIRVMYTNPDGINDELLSLLAQEEKICPYLDMPVQHAHPRILKAMGRAGQAERFLALIAKVRKRVPGICLRTTLLSGFPGETESEHQTLLKFVREAQFDRLGVFTYSREQGTPAGQMPGQIHHRIRQRRCRELMETQLGISRRRLQQKVGAELECIIEEPSGLHHVLGRTRADAPEVDGAVVLQGRARPGTIVRACITGSTDYDLQGVIKGVVG